MASEGFTNRCAGDGVPEPHRLVITAGSKHRPPINDPERHRGHPARVADEGLADDSAGARFPEPHRLIMAAGSKHRHPINDPERHRGHRPGMAGEGFTDWRAGDGVPEPHRLIMAAGSKHRAPTDCPEGHRGHRPGMAGEGSGRVSHDGSCGPFRCHSRVGRCRVSSHRARVRGPQLTTLMDRKWTEFSGEVQYHSCLHATAAWGPEQLGRQQSR